MSVLGEKGYLRFNDETGTHSDGIILGRWATSPAFRHKDY